MEELAKPQDDKLSRLKLALKEKLARKKAILASLQESTPNTNTSIGFGGRLIYNQRPHPISGNASFVGLNGTSSEIGTQFGSNVQTNVQNTVPVQTQNPESGQSSFGSTPQMQFILDDQRKVSLTPKVFKAEMKRMRKSAEDALV